MSALVIGAMVPDWPLMFEWGPNYAQTHALWGIPLVCMPMGLLLLLTYELLIRGSLVQLLPRWFRERLVANPTRAGSVASSQYASAWFWLVAAVAVMIGSASHVMIDSFTHVDRWGTNLVPALNRTALAIGSWEVPMYKLLQHGGSALGLPMLLAVFVFWTKRQTPEQELHGRSNRWRATWLSFLVTSVVAGTAWFLRSHEVTSMATLVSLIMRGSMSGGAIGLLIFGLANQRSNG